MNRTRFLLWLAVILLAGAALYGGIGYTVINSVAIKSSTIDGTPIGATTPSSMVFTTAKGAGFTGSKNVVTDGGGNIVEGGTSLSGDWQIFVAAGCAISDPTDGTWCSGTISLPVAYADNSYMITCQSVTNNDAIGYLKVKAKSTGSFTYDYTATRGNGVSGYTPNEMCFAYHP